ncbi:MAG: hypothetical protein JWP47_924 [Polaromonas sp.]|jgi:hypothetical protein|nr:hypothetical protein [Polaromonas sp.]
MVNIDSTQTDDPAQWLGATRLLDLDDPKLRICAMRVTQLATGDAQKAVVVHDFVKSLPFGCVAAFDHVPAAVVLRTGRGDCHTKGTLFVAMLRSVGVPARLRFVLLSSNFLKGIIDIPQGQIAHAIGEVFLKGRWVQTDTYVPDEPFEKRALSLLKERHETLGLGVHVDALRDWDGCHPAYSQYCDEDPPSLPLRDLGVAHDPELFYSDKTNEEFQLGWLTRAKWMLAAPVVNRRVGQIRRLASPQD